MTLGNIKPWTVIGYRADGSPIHLLAGGAADDDDDDTGIDLEGGGTAAGRAAAEDDDEPDDEPEDDDKPAAPAAKAVTEADLKRVTGALEKERAAAKEARAKVREMQAELRAAKKAAEPGGADDEATTKAVEAAVTEAENRYKPMVVNETAKALLFAAGLSPDTSPAALKRLLKTIDLADVDVDEDGVTGLDDQIDQIKETFPALFAKPEPEAPAPRIRAPKIDAAGRKNEPPKPKTTGELYAERIHGARN